MEERSSTNKLVVTALTAFVLGFGFSWLILNRSGFGTEERGDRQNTQQAASISQPVIVGKNAVLVENQAPGNSVGVSSVKLEHDGWVAIHEDRNGSPGNILGARWFPAGEHAEETVELLRATTAGATFYAMLHSDDGDRKFDYTKDLPLKDDAGQAVMITFVATP